MATVPPSGDENQRPAAAKHPRRTTQQVRVLVAGDSSCDRQIESLNI